MRRALTALTRRVPRLVLEIAAGVVIGPSVLGLVHPGEPLHRVSDVGAALLLFIVGMHVDVDGLRSAGRSATRVALAGMAAPVAAGFAVAELAGENWHTALFLGAALSATSIGITARVFRDAGRLSSPEAHVVIGAAVIDDVLGLVLLAAVTALASTGGFDTSVVVSSVSIIGSFFLGAAVSRTASAGRIEKTATLAGTLLVPVFFLHIGMKADLSVVSSAGTVGLAALVLVVAMATKLLAGMAAGNDAGDKLTIGLAMSPRGEVGLIFASTAVAAGAFDDRLYAVVVIVVLGTTVLTPSLLRRRLAP